jgi:uncharacterized membrane protein
MKMTRNSAQFIKYLILALLAGIAIWQIFKGDSSFGIGLLVGVIVAASILKIKQHQIIEMQEKGMNPYDERAWSLAGLAAYGAIRIFAVSIALFVLVGSIWGPQVQVNPYNLLGLCLCGLLGLYVGSYYYYNRKI